MCVTRVHRPGFTDHIYALQRKRIQPLVRHDASMCHTFHSHVCSLRPPDLYPRMSTLQHIATTATHFIRKPVPCACLIYILPMRSIYPQMRPIHLQMRPNYPQMRPTYPQMRSIYPQMHSVLCISRLIRILRVTLCL